MSGTNTRFSTEALVLKGICVGEMRPSRKLKSIGITICVVWLEFGKLVSGIGVTAQQEWEWHGGLKAVLSLGMTRCTMQPRVCGADE